MDIVGGAKSWFNLGVFKFQPSEFAKFATALALAKYYNNIYIKKISFTEKIRTYIIILLPFLLIIAQNDLGTALIYSGFIFVLYREGLSGNILIVGLISIILFILTLLINKIIIIGILTGISFFNLFIFQKEKI